MATPWRLFWLLVIAGHAVAAAAWWWLSPGGFPLWHPRFWVNRVLPLAVLAVVTTAVVASRRHRLDMLLPILIAFPAAWGAAALVARVLFPITLETLFFAPLVGALLMGAAALMTFRRHASTSSRSIVAVTAAAALTGAAIPLSQRAPDPDTHPLDPPRHVTPQVTDPELVARGWSGSRIRVHSGEGSLSFKAQAVNLSLHPLLTFISRSPDGCWTCLARRKLRDGPALVLDSSMVFRGGLNLLYHADYDATLWIAPASETGPIHLEATAVLPRPIFSHLNSFCDLMVSGHKQLSLSFSPCPDQLVEVRPADYPVGRPLRLAYRDARDGFHVVEAASGEKGPFRTLARGRLARSEALAITLHDQGKAVARVVFEDWAAQTDTALSPTAGWGVPVNAIEFSLEGDLPQSLAAIYLTLSGTSVGRGWESVGHRAGTYRNRVRIEFPEVYPPRE